MKFQNIGQVLGFGGIVGDRFLFKELGIRIVLYFFEENKLNNVFKILRKNDLLKQNFVFSKIVIDCDDRLRYFRLLSFGKVYFLYIFFLEDSGGCFLLKKRKRIKK